MDWTQIITALIGGIVTVSCAVSTSQLKKHNQHHDTDREITIAAGKVRSATARLSEYTALALKNGKANGELDALRRNLRDAEDVYEASLMRK
jgi:hypothetical protein